MERGFESGNWRGRAQFCEPTPPRGGAPSSSSADGGWARSGSGMWSSWGCGYRFENHGVTSSGSVGDQPTGAWSVVRGGTGPTRWSVGNWGPVSPSGVAPESCSGEHTDRGSGRTGSVDVGSILHDAIVLLPILIRVIYNQS